MENLNTRNKPKYLNWKCIDNFDKVSDEKIFYDGKIKLNEIQRRNAKKHFGDIKKKFTKSLNEFIEETSKDNKTHLTISGGNYTFFYVLPQLVKWISNKYPFLGVHMKLFERGGSTSFQEHGADILLTSSLRGEPSDEASKYPGYKILRKFAKDSILYVASNESFGKYKDTKELLQNQDILFSRYYATQYEMKPLEKKYGVARKGVKPRVSVDQYFLECNMIAHSIGLGYLFSSLKMNKRAVSVVYEGDHLKRFAIIKNKVDKRYVKIARKAINTLYYKECEL